MSGRREPAILLALGLVALAASAIAPHDYFTWFLEVAPALIAAPILVLTARRFPLTPLAYRLILVHAVILMAGGHWTYAEVPLGYWIRDHLHLARNPYDRIGHLAQGFVPAILAREILLRRTPLTRGAWLVFITTSICLAISAAYELVEWAVAEMTGSAADAFLGTQGDPWDTQWDMFSALIGSIAAQILLARWHDRQVAAMRAPAAA